MAVECLLWSETPWPRWALMWSLAFAIYVGCKWLTWRRTPARGASLVRRLGYLLAWPGMDAAAFLNPHSPVLRPKLVEWLFATCKLAMGAALVFTATRLDVQPYLAGWLAMIGIVLTLHFGVFHLLSCTWRHAGVDAKPIMHWPIAATSVSEFWGQRWNRAFRDLTHRFLFRPMSARFGPRWAIAGGFLVSGVVHDLVISVPAGGGFGGPSAFFVVQGAAIFVERSALGRRLGLTVGWRGWVFTMLVLLAPVPGLFHSAFVLEIMVPFLQVIGGS